MRLWAARSVWSRYYFMGVKVLLCRHVVCRNDQCALSNQKMSGRVYDLSQSKWTFEWSFVKKMSALVLLVLTSSSPLLSSDVLFTAVDFFCIHFLKEFANILQNESRGEEAVKHCHPGLRLYVYVHCFSNMWQYRGMFQIDLQLQIHQSVVLTVLFIYLHSKQLSRASITLSSMGADTQGLHPSVIFYILFFVWCPSTQ